ncbi:MAG: hypothetical protein HY791_09000 [Deltaproteobacteria bacterium]|nr:hypothetical protein [Deltaproteobacteria bacterium]
MKSVMHTVPEVIEKIEAGQRLLLAGDESQLGQLPRGEWIGGTIPYFMAEGGGLFSRDRIFVTEVPAYVSKVEIATYDADTIQRIYADAPEHGLTVAIMPASSATHLSFALGAPSFKKFASQPVVGWVSGVFLSDLGKVKPKVFDGRSAKGHEQDAVVMRMILPSNRIAEIGILNIFEQSSGDAITFAQDGFSVQEAFVNGERVDFAEYVTRSKLDLRLPLVADYYGAMVNISFQAVGEREVKFYAPVFKGITYRQAKPIKDYVAQFTSQIPEGAERITFSCNCILNYLYSELEGKRTADITGPITFGEVAYQLLNQTMVYATITEVD